MTGLIDYIARALVDRPDEVEVQEVPAEGGGTVIELRVARDDLGKVIGRQGRTARAIRTLLAAAASKKNRRTALEIIE
jgi:predicted RNA-binding protein YlqC (UPF0109 family)